MGKKAPKIRNIRFLLASSGAHKREYYNAALVGKRQHFINKLRLAARVALLGSYAQHHLPLETALTLKGNAFIKSNGTNDDFQRVNAGGDLHDYYKERLAIEDGTDHFDPREHYHIVDDGGVAIPMAIAMASREALLEHLLPELVIWGKEYIDGNQYALFHEIGPICRSMGAIKFWTIIRDTARELGFNDGQWRCYEQIKVLARHMADDPKKPACHFETVKPFTLLNLDMLLPGRLQGADQFFRSPAGLTEQNFYHYPSFVGSKKNPRYIIMKQLMSYADKVLRRDKKIVGFRVIDKSTLPSVEDLRVFQLLSKPMIVNGKPLTQIAGHPLKIAGTMHKNCQEKFDFLEACSMEFVGKHPDMVIMPPFDPKNYEERLIASLRFKNFCRAKATDPRFANVNMLIFNLNGCYDFLLQASADGSNAGLTSNFPIKPILEIYGLAEAVGIAPNIDYDPTFYYHEIRGTDDEAMACFANKLAVFLLKDYVRHELSPSTDDEIEIIGAPLPEGAACVVGFISASSDGKQLCEDAHRYFKHIGEMGLPVCLGGGDQHGMGEQLAGYREAYSEAGGNHLHLASTFDLVTVETKKAALPFCDYGQLSRRMTERLLTLVTGNPEFDVMDKLRGPRLLTVFDGGEGTDEEVLFALAIQMLAPEKMRDTTILLYLPAHSIKGSMYEAIFGEENFAELVAKGKLDHFNIKLATHYDQLIAKTNRWATKHRVAAVKPTPTDKVVSSETARKG